MAREAKERIVEREFMRVGETVRKDLASYPHLHRSLSEAIAGIEQDHQGAGGSAARSAGLGEGRGNRFEARVEERRQRGCSRTSTSPW